uniref:Uncharacterized protein n=1 Tax=Oryza glumipatula TaxID=40148 RepID=A0A0E0BRM7_9ORYZ
MAVRRRRLPPVFGLPGREGEWIRDALGMLLVQGIALGLTVVTGIDGDGWRLVLEKIEGISPMTASWLDYSRLCAPGTLNTLVARGLGQRRLQSTGTAKWPTAALWTSRAASSLAQATN